MISTSNQGGIQTNLISFLEGNLPSVGMTQQEEEDVILNSLLPNGKLEELKLSDAKLLVRRFGE